MNTIERLLKGVSPLPWKVSGLRTFVSITTDTKSPLDNELVAEFMTKNGCRDAEFIVLMANAGPRLVEQLQWFIDNTTIELSAAASDNEADHAYSVFKTRVENARALLNDLLGDDDQAKRAYMQRSMRETRKK